MLVLLVMLLFSAAPNWRPGLLIISDRQENDLSSMEKLCLIGGSAFALSQHLLKGYDNPRHLRSTDWITALFDQGTFWKILLAERWTNLTSNYLSDHDPQFAADVATVACCLHNICERILCEFEPAWLIEAHDGINLPPHAVANTAMPALQMTACRHSCSAHCTTLCMRRHQTILSAYLFVCAYGGHVCLFFRLFSPPFTLLPFPMKFGKKLEGQ